MISEEMNLLTNCCIDFSLRCFISRVLTLLLSHHHVRSRLLQSIFLVVNVDFPFQLQDT